MTNKEQFEALVEGDRFYFEDAEGNRTVTFTKGADGSAYTREQNALYGIDPDAFPLKAEDFDRTFHPEDLTMSGKLIVGESPLVPAEPNPELKLMLAVFGY